MHELWATFKTRSTPARQRYQLCCVSVLARLGGNVNDLLFAVYLYSFHFDVSAQPVIGQVFHNNHVGFVNSGSFVQFGSKTGRKASFGINSNIYVGIIGIITSSSYVWAVKFRSSNIAIHKLPSLIIP